MLPTGTVAPPFSLSNQDGETVSLSDFKVHWVLLYFYPKDNTPGCTAEACGIRDAWDEFRSAGVVVLGVSSDSVKKHQVFAQEFQLPFMLLSDPERVVIKQYQALGEKKMFGKTYLGTLRVSYLLDSQGVVRKIYPSVDPATHAQEILSDLKGLL